MKEDLSKLSFDELKKFVKTRTGRIEELGIEVELAKFLIKKKIERGEFSNPITKKKIENKPEKATFKTEDELKI